MSLLAEICKRYDQLAEIDTGGGCIALAGANADGYVVMTDKGGCYLPTDDDFLIGFYKTEADFIDGQDALIFLESQP